MLSNVAQQFGREFGIPVECSISGEPFLMNQVSAHEVLMIAREGLYNSIRHAHPHRIRLSVEFRDDACTLKIIDDGCGFDVHSLSEPSNNHYGLLGMRERVERLGGKFTLESNSGAGTQITIAVPRKTADATPISEMSL